MKKSTLALFVAISFITACKKTDNNSSVITTPYGTYSSMAAVFAAQANQPKYFTVNAATGGSFYGNSGTRYIFQANSFVDGSGNNVTGNVQIAATEYLRKGDIIFSKMLPVSNNEPLLSGGEVNVTATQNGNPVFLKPGYVFQANMPQGGKAQAGMSLFVGTPSKDTTVSAVNWVNNIDTGRGSIAYIMGSGSDTISIRSEYMRECNADQFMANPNFQNFKVTAAISGVTIPSTAAVFGYALYDNYKGVWPLGWTGSYSDGVFTEEHVPNIPVHFVLFTLINNKFYGGVLAATPTTGNNYTVALTQVDPTAFKGQLNNLVN